MYDADNKLVATFPAESGMENTTPEDQFKENAGPTPEGIYEFEFSDFRLAGVYLKVAQMIRNMNLKSPFTMEFFGYKIKENNPFGADFGEANVKLIPVGDFTTRTGIYIHGGNFPYSKGCIDVGKNIINLRNLLSKEKGTIRIVVDYKPGRPLFNAELQRRNTKQSPSGSSTQPLSALDTFASHEKSMSHDPSFGQRQSTEPEQNGENNKTDQEDYHSIMRQWMKSSNSSPRSPVETPTDDSNKTENRNSGEVGYHSIMQQWQKDPTPILQFSNNIEPNYSAILDDHGKKHGDSTPTKGSSDFEKDDAYGHGELWRKWISASEPISQGLGGSPGEMKISRDQVTSLIKTHESKAYPIPNNLISNNNGQLMLDAMNEMFATMNDMAQKNLADAVATAATFFFEDKSRQINTAAQQQNNEKEQAGRQNIMSQQQEYVNSLNIQQEGQSTNTTAYSGQSDTTTDQPHGEYGSGNYSSNPGNAISGSGGTNSESGTAGLAKSGSGDANSESGTAGSAKSGSGGSRVWNVGRPNGSKEGAHFYWILKTK